jgi:hypothetical protein
MILIFFGLVLALNMYDIFAAGRYETINKSINQSIKKSTKHKYQHGMRSE